jgi:hypothetical protein
MLDRVRDFLEAFHPRYLCVGCLSKATEIDLAILGRELARLRIAGSIDLAQTECLACYVLGPAFRARAA